MLELLLLLAQLFSSDANTANAFGRKQGLATVLEDFTSPAVLVVQRSLVERTRAAVLSKYPPGAVQGAISAQNPLTTPGGCYNDRIGAAFRKLLRGESIKLAVFGSSVTAGADGVGSTRSFAHLVAEGIRGWLSSPNPGERAAEANRRVVLQSVAQGGVNTIYPTMLMDSLMGPRDPPDIALWEYALNDFTEHAAQKRAMLHLFVQRLDERSMSFAAGPPGLGFVGMWDYNEWPPRNSSLDGVAQTMADTPSSFMVDFARFLLAVGAGAPGGNPPDVRVNKGHHPSAVGHRMLADLILYHLAGVMLAVHSTTVGAAAAAAVDSACTGGGAKPRVAVREWPFAAGMRGLPFSRSMSWLAFQPAFGRSVLPPPCLAARAAGSQALSPCVQGQRVALIAMGKSDPLRADRKLRVALPTCPGDGATTQLLLTFFVPGRVTRLLLMLKEYQPTSLLVNGKPLAVDDLVELGSGSAFSSAYFSHAVRLHGTAAHHTLQLCAGKLEPAAVARHKQVGDKVTSKMGLRLLGHVTDTTWDFGRVNNRISRMAEKGKISGDERDVLDGFVQEWHNTTRTFSWLVGLYPPE